MADSIEEKERKILQMRKNIEEVKAERHENKQDEQHHRMGVKPITHFPYTHGDTVEAARA